MHRIDNQTAVPTLPNPQPLGIPGFFFNGDPRRGRLATRLDQDFFNALQEEISHVIEEAGLTLDKTRFDQLLLAIIIHIQRHQPELPFLPLAGGTMQGVIYQHISPTNPAELTHKAYVDARDNAVIAHSDAMDVHYHNEAVGYANARAIQEGDRAQNQAWAWDQQIWDRVNWIDATQGGMDAFLYNDTFVVPGAARVINCWVTGAGGGGGGSHNAQGGAGGGGAGGTAIGAFGVSPGQHVSIMIGDGGEPGQGNGSAGGPGGASQIGDFLGASGGGGGGGSAQPHPAGADGGVGYGGGVHLFGGMGGDGANQAAIGKNYAGHGGASFWGGGGRGGTTEGFAGRAPGSGGGGSYAAGAWGGRGARGWALITWHR